MNIIISILLHIKEDCIDIKDFLNNQTETDFYNSKLLQKAVCMSLINIGELVKSLPENFISEHHDIPWKRIAGLRDIVAHKYKTLDMEAVWAAANERIPELFQYVVGLLATSDN